MNSGVRFIIWTISSAVWDRTDAMCGGSAGVVPLCSSRLASMGKGVESEEALGNVFDAVGGAWAGAGGGSRLSASSKSSGSSSSRLMVVVVTSQEEVSEELV